METLSLFAEPALEAPKRVVVKIPTDHVGCRKRCGFVSASFTAFLAHSYWCGR